MALNFLIEIITGESKQVKMYLNAIDCSVSTNIVYSLTNFALYRSRILVRLSPLDSLS